MTIPRPVWALALPLLLAVLAGCNTVEGVGRDVQATGKAIERSAR